MIYYIPFVLQAGALFFDEFYFHHRRNLPRWERFGHPLDTLSVLLCYIFILTMPYSTNHLYIYIGLCSFSSLFVTKDEFVHSKECTPQENWLHSLLFILHPITFLCAGFIWFENSPAMSFIQTQTAIIGLFLIYQILYWNVYEPKKR